MAHAHRGGDVLERRVRNRNRRHHHRRHLRRKGGKNLVCEIVVEIVAGNVGKLVDETVDVGIVLCKQCEQQQHDRPAVGETHDPIDDVGREIRSRKNAGGFFVVETKFVAAQREHLVGGEIVGEAQRQRGSGTDQDDAFGRSGRQHISQEREDGAVVRDRLGMFENQEGVFLTALPRVQQRAAPGCRIRLDRVQMQQRRGDRIASALRFPGECRQRAAGKIDGVGDAVAVADGVTIEPARK